MKKLLFLLGLLLVSGLLFSCAADDEEDDDSQNLGWYLANGKVYLAVPKVEKTLLIQIYRKDASGNIYNIGEINPSYVVSTISYAFEDELVANKPYTYMAFYLLYESPGYFATDWTDTIYVTGSAYDTEPTPVVSSSAYLDYDEDTLRMTMTGGNISFTDESDDSIFKKYSLALGVKKSDSNHIVKLGDVYNATTDWDRFEETEDIVMDSVLPTSWQNQTLSLLGAIYKKEELFPSTSDETNYLYKTIHWSLPKAVKLVIDSKTVTSFTVSKGSAEDVDYIYSGPITNE
ncbi:MAG: hypothetical protein K6F15_05320 [Treponema sp.]|nr:hypothetical protein [Treponema sp.]